MRSYPASGWLSFPTTTNIRCVGQRSSRTCPELSGPISIPRQDTILLRTPSVIHSGLRSMLLLLLPPLEGHCVNNNNNIVIIIGKKTCPFSGHAFRPFASVSSQPPPPLLSIYANIIQGRGLCTSLPSNLSIDFRGILRTRKIIIIIMILKLSKSPLLSVFCIRRCP